MSRELIQVVVAGTDDIAVDLLAGPVSVRVIRVGVLMQHRAGVPVTPVATVELVITGVGGLIVIVRVASPVPAEFPAPKLTVYVPDVVGVPEIAPFAVLIDKPGGRPLALKLVGLFVATSV